MSMKAEDRIIKARVQLLSKEPFWGMLILHLTFEKLDDIPTIAVSEHGRVYYNEEFINNLSDDELKGVLAHEVSHLMLNHLERLGNRDPFRANMAMDYVVNLILLDNGFKLPNGALVNYDYRDMCWEEVYDKLPKDVANKCPYDCSSCPFKKGKIPPFGKPVVCRNGSFDKHIFGDQLKRAKGKDGKLDRKSLKRMGLPEGLSGRKLSKHKPNWRKIVADAYNHAKLIGKLPSGMDRLIEDIVEPKLNWREKLYRFITRSIPFNYSYSRPSRKSIPSGYYFPHVLKEKLEVIGCIDTSGSMSDEEIAEGLGHFLSIVKSFPNIDLTLFSCDAKLYVANKVASEHDLKVAKLKGGGGTDFRPIFKWIRDNTPNARLLVFFTDAFGVFPKQSEVPPGLTTIWVISRKGDPNNVPSYFQNVIKME